MRWPDFAAGHAKYSKLPLSRSLHYLWQCVCVPLHAAISPAVLTDPAAALLVLETLQLLQRHMAVPGLQSIVPRTYKVPPHLSGSVSLTPQTHPNAKVKAAVTALAS